MIMAEKIASLRRRNGWSQEELAEKMSISRQSVSKWESGASIPDLDKIIKMSSIFSVSTDYLLKDELDEISILPQGESEEEFEGRRVSLEEANAFMEMSRLCADKIAAAVGLFILSPICMILLGGVSETYPERISEDLAVGIGVAVLLVLVAVGVGVVIINGLRLSKYEYMEKEKIYTEYGVSGIVQKKKEDFMPEFRKKVATGVILFIIGVVPLIIASALGQDEMVAVFCVGILLLMVACGVFLVISAGVISGSYDKLLEMGDYTPENKIFRKKTEFFPGIYWCVVTAIYLAVSFYSNIWKRTWIIYAVAGVLFAAICGIMRAAMQKKKM